MAGGDGSQALVATVAARRGRGPRLHPGRHAQPLRARPRPRPRRRGRRARRLHRRHRAAHRPRARQRPRVRQQRLARRVRQGRPVRRLPRRQARDLDAACCPTCSGPDAEPIDLEFTAPDGQQLRRRAARARLEQPLRSSPACRAPAHAGGSTTGVLGVFAARVRASADVSKLVGARARRTGRSLFGPAGVVGGASSRSAPAGRSRSAWTARRSCWTRRCASPRCPGPCACGCPRGAGLSPAARAVSAHARQPRARCCGWPPAGELARPTPGARPGAPSCWSAGGRRAVDLARRVRARCKLMREVARERSAGL